ncbi:hypothetical protein GH714_010512 [Hevea brasiliensis]|uniref:Uncharacterized protein n=1 Tax=Hevea brasiliensis TaxID=3981 RepID=A0A6A6KXC4_HEVBR|nr:hypothetical protein GH714_010512 [Hevea brasiliensis]
MPAGLSPIRGIEYQIDFVPGAVIPNRPAYRTNPEETKELQRQVEELLAKGYVRERLELIKLKPIFDTSDLPLELYDIKSEYVKLGNDGKREFPDDRIFKESVAQSFERMNLQMNDFRDELDVLRGMRNEMTRFMEEMRRDKEDRNRRNDGGANVQNPNRNEGRFRAEHRNEGSGERVLVDEAMYRDAVAAQFERLTLGMNTLRDDMNRILEEMRRDREERARGRDDARDRRQEVRNIGEPRWRTLRVKCMLRKSLRKQ